MIAIRRSCCLFFRLTSSFSFCFLPRRGHRSLSCLRMYSLEKEKEFELSTTNNKNERTKKDIQISSSSLFDAVTCHLSLGLNRMNPMNRMNPINRINRKIDDTRIIEGIKRYDETTMAMAITMHATHEKTVLTVLLFFYNNCLLAPP